MSLPYRPEGLSCKRTCQSPLKESKKQADVLANADYRRAGYGVLTEAECEAVKLFAKYEGLLLDPVYKGRAAVGMIDLIRKGFFKKDETLLP
jgi:L-cysteate sulfo-lyase